MQPPIDNLIDVILDLRAALHEAASNHQIPPTTAADERLIERFQVWSRMCDSLIAHADIVKASLVEASLADGPYKLRDQLSALLALPRGAPNADIVQCTRIMLKRLQELELQAVNEPAKSNLIRTAPVTALIDQVTDLRARVEALEATLCEQRFLTSR